MGYKNLDGTWHDRCLDEVHQNEPIFMLRAQDLHASTLVRLWAYLAALTGCPKEKIREAEQTANAMEAWHGRKYPD